MVVTDDDELYHKMSILKAQAVSPLKKYWHIEVGYNYRMTNMQAAVGLGQLENIEWHIRERERVAKLYAKYLKGTETYMKMQYVPTNFKQTYWMNNVILQDTVKKERDQVMAEMEACNIEMRPVFYPMHIMPPYLDNTVSYPVAEMLGSRGISLPSHSLLTEEAVEYVCKSLKKIVLEG